MLRALVASLCLLTGCTVVQKLTDFPPQARRTTPPVGLEHALAEGATAPDFSVALTGGTRFVLAEALRRGPVVLVFYRGHW